MTSKLKASLAVLAVWACTGMTCGNADCANLKEGACKVSFARFASDATLNLQFPEGGGVQYGSSPNQIAGQSLAIAEKALTALVARDVDVPLKKTPQPDQP